MISDTIDNSRIHFANYKNVQILRRYSKYFLFQTAALNFRVKVCMGTVEKFTPKRCGPQ